MDENIIKFLNKEVNVLPLYDEKGKLITTISRESMPNGVECLYINYIDGDKIVPMYSPLFYNPNKKEKSEKPKNTGGRKPYIMLMIDEMEELRKKGVKNVEELIGYVVCLGKYIEWHTGRLIHKRSKKPLQYNDLLAIYGCSNNKLNKMLKLMKEHDLLYHTKEGYFISQKYIKKGKSKKSKD